MRYRDQLALLQNQHVIGDNHEELEKLPADFFHCAVTSPPYFGLRDYGTRRWFGGDPECSHVETEEHGPHHPGQVEQTKWKTAEAAGKGQTATTLSCVQCGAWYGQLGLEPTPDCGRPKMRLRKDLTPAQRAYVVQRLQAAGLVSSDCGTGGTTSDRSRGHGEAQGTDPKA